MRNRVLGSRSVIRVQSWESQAPAPAAAEQVLGIAWPKETGTVVCGRADIICTGPTDWLVFATEAAGIDQRLNDAFEGTTFRATNVSHALGCIEIDGSQARDLLSKGCSLDFHPPLFPPGRCARTRFAGMPVVVRCTQPLTFELIAASSYQDYLVSWLTDAAMEFSTTKA